MSENEYPIMKQGDITNAYTLPHKTARYQDFTIDLTDLLRHRGPYSPFNCHISCAFETLRWMSFLAERWHKRKKTIHPICLLLDHVRGVNPSPYYHTIQFFDGWSDLRNGLPGIFDILLLEDEPGEVDAWRARYRLRAYERCVIPAPATASMRHTYRWDGFADSCDTRRTLEKLLSFSGDFVFSPNGYHPNARWAYQTTLYLERFPKPRWQIIANYTYPRDSGSSWYVLVAEQQSREAFHYFIDRALLQLRNMCGIKSDAEGGK
jgi:hypothetical protein